MFHNTLFAALREGT